MAQFTGSEKTAGSYRRVSWQAWQSMNIQPNLRSKGIAKQLPWALFATPKPWQGSCTFDKENSSDEKPSTEVHVAWQVTLAGALQPLELDRGKLPHHKGNTVTSGEKPRNCTEVDTYSG
jgi:hypothetical protein